MPGRSRTRSKKGGDSLSVPNELNDLENSLKSIKSDVDLALEKLKSLGENIQSKEEEKEEVEEEKEEVEEEKPKTQTEEEQKEDDTDSEEEPEEVIEEIKLDDQPISINGFDGTVKQLKDSMKRKAAQLSKNKRYKDKADSITATIKEINDKAATSKDVEEIVTGNTSLTFKNNNLMGGKKTVSNKKKKARRSRKKH
jgi:chromosome segregation ATPase